MIPITEMLVDGYNNWRDLTVFVMVFAVDLILLKVAAALMLLDPIQSNMLAGSSGQDPCSARHATCSTLSPPMPKLIQSGR